MIVLGVDPGYSLVGVGVVKYENNEFSLLEAKVIDTSKISCFDEKLLIIYQEIEKILEVYKPQVVVIEQLFFSKNRKTALLVSQSTGVIRFCVARKGIRALEITPLEVKRSIVGSSGYHPKVQIQNIVKLVFGLKDVIKPDDASDAVAVAVAGVIMFR